MISSIANNPNNDPEINAKFAQAMADLQAGGNNCGPSSHLPVSVQSLCNQSLLPYSDVNLLLAQTLPYSAGLCLCELHDVKDTMAWSLFVKSVCSNGA